MRDGLLIRWRGAADPVDWLRVEGGRAGLVQHEWAPAAAVLAKAARVIVVVPAEWVTTLALDLPVRKADAARKAAPFAAEEWLAAPIEAMHVAVAEQPVAGTWPVCAIARTVFSDLVGALRERGIVADAVVTDAACVAEGRALAIDGRVIARLDGARAFAVETAQWPAFAASAGRDARAETIDALLPECVGGADAAVNLLQGDFASGHRDQGAWRAWRMAAVLALAAVLVHTIWLQLDVVRLRHRLEALNTAMVDQYRARFPDARQVPNPRLMIEQALHQAGDAGASRGGGLDLLARAAPVLANQPQSVLAGADYRGGKLELRIDAPDVGALDALRESLGAALSVPVSLDSATANNGRVDGRLSLGAAP